MFHLTLPHKKTATYSPHWQELLHQDILQKRVVRGTHTQPYHRQTLAESIHSACMKSFGFSGEAEATAMRVCKDVESWLIDKEEVTVADIRRRAAVALQHYNPRAAYEYLPTKEYQVHEDQYGFIRL